MKIMQEETAAKIESGFVESLQQYGVFDLIVVSLGIALIAYISIVFLNRVFKVAKRTEPKYKVVAVISAIMSALFLAMKYDSQSIFQLIYSFILHNTVSLAIFMLIDFIITKLKLGERFDNFLDKKGLEDKPTKTSRKKR